ncbi:hypothetical protein [Parafrankia soli]|uniref:hypothetical protein n=1 Tax=Parafrankia soli TaxID=2599596 RepID=UPI0008DAA7DA|nr:hypothetical protein [Parafrankia soli]
MTVTETAVAPAPASPVRWNHLDQVRDPGFTGLAADAPRHVGNTTDGNHVHVATAGSKLIYGPAGVGKTVALDVDIAGAALDPAARIVLLGAWRGELEAWRPLAETYADTIDDTTQALLALDAEVEERARARNAALRARAERDQGEIPAPPATWIFLDEFRSLELELGERSAAAAGLRMALLDLLEHGPRLGYRLVLTDMRVRMQPWMESLFGQVQKFGPNRTTPGLSTIHVPGKLARRPLLGAYLSPSERVEVGLTALRLRAAQAAPVPKAV